MPDFFYDGAVLPPNTRPIDVWATDASTHTPESTTTFKEYKVKLTPVLKTRRDDLDAAVTRRQELGARVSEISARLDAAKQDGARLRVSYCREIIGLGPAADARALGALLGASDDQISVLTDTLDMLQHVLIPDALIDQLQAALDLVRVDEAMANIEHSLARSEMLDRAIQAGLFDSGKMGLFSEKVDALYQAKELAARRVTDAENELREARKKMEADRQTRTAHGLITRAEISATIPNYAG